MISIEFENAITAIEKLEKMAFRAGVKHGLQAAETALAWMEVLPASPQKNDVIKWTENRIAEYVDKLKETEWTVK